MKQTIRWLLLTVCAFPATLSLVSQPAFSQCEVSTERTETGSLSVKTAPEKVYQNEDLENGFKQISLQTVAIIRGQAKDYFLMAIASQSRGQNLPIARVIQLVLGGTAIDLQAETMKTIPLPEHRAEMILYWYPLDGKTMDRIVQQECNMIQVKDTRTGQSMSIYKVTDLLKTQLKCIQKEVAGIANY